MDCSGGYSDHAFVAEFYDHVEPYRNRQDVTFFVEAAKEAGAPVLELGCGTGRVLVPTARAGIEIVGLDLSPHMLRACQERLLREPEEVQARVELVLADMRHFELGRKFKLVTTPFRPFQHLIAIEDQLACLESVHRHLVEGGKLILDLFNPSLEVLVADNVGQELGEEPQFTTPDGRCVLRRHRFVAKDRFRQVNQVEMIYYVRQPDGREERLVHAFPMRYLFRYETEHLLARGGFEVQEVFADYDESPYGSKYPGELILVAKKV